MCLRCWARCPGRVVGVYSPRHYSGKAEQHRESWRPIFATRFRYGACVVINIGRAIGPGGSWVRYSPGGWPGQALAARWEANSTAQQLRRDEEFDENLPRGGCGTACGGVVLVSGLLLATAYASVSAHTVRAVQGYDDCAPAPSALVRGDAISAGEVRMLVGVQYLEEACAR
ncbi:unnamed protein product [Amoebophrya sp. A120]|nr:unnamed protein product [Amoebophrya sp. A120]|eukprot:GSA120T00013629001.1